MQLQPFDVHEIVESMAWDHGISIMRAAPSPLFWQAWHGNKIWMRNFGFRVHKAPAGWAVFVQNPSLINLLQKEFSG